AEAEINDANEKRRGPTKWLIGGTLGVAAIAIVLALAAIAVSGGSTRTSPPPSSPTTTIANITVPVLPGKPTEAALQELVFLGLQVTLQYRADRTAPHGTVVSQNPPPGISLPAGSNVVLGFS